MTKLKITILNIGSLKAKMFDFYAFTREHPYASKTEYRPIQCYHISILGRSVMVDASAYEFPAGTKKFYNPKKSYFFTGDMYHHALEFSEPEMNVRWVQPAVMATSKQMLINRVATSEAEVYCTHIEGPYGVQREGDVVRWRSL